MMMRSVLRFDQEQFHRDQFVGQGSRERMFNSGAPAGDPSIASGDSGCPTFVDPVGLTPTLCWGNAVENSGLPRGKLGVTPWKTWGNAVEKSALAHRGMRRAHHSHFS